MKNNLTKRQDAFVTEYVKDGNATQAAIRAGYSVRSARVTGHRLLTNATLQQRLDQAGREGLETLIDIAANGKSEAARVQASSILLDRAWGKATTRLEVNQSIVRIALDLTGAGEKPPDN